MAREMEWCALAGCMVPKRGRGAYFDETSGHVVRSFPKDKAARAMLGALEELHAHVLKYGADEACVLRMIRTAIDKAEAAGIKTED